MYIMFSLKFAGAVAQNITRHRPELLQYIKVLSSTTFRCQTGLRNGCLTERNVALEPQNWNCVSNRCLHLSGFSTSENIKNYGSDVSKLEDNVDNNETENKDAVSSDEQVNSKPGSEEERYVVCLSGLPYQVSEKDIITFFAGCNVKGGTEGIHLEYRASGLLTGDAYVELESLADFVEALRKSRQYIEKRYIIVTPSEYKMVENCKEMYEKELQPVEKLVKLRGIHFMCTAHDIKEFFNGLEIAEDGVDFLYNERDMKTGAFIEFQTAEMAKEALLRHRTYMDKRSIEVYRTTVRDLEFCKARQVQQKELGNPQRFSSPQYTSQTGNTIYMRGLPYRVNEYDILYFFHPIEPAQMKIYYMKDTDRATGDAHVDFNSVEDMRAGMSKDRCYIRHRYVELFVHTEDGKCLVPSRDTEQEALDN